MGDNGSFGFCFGKRRKSEEETGLVGWIEGGEDRLESLKR